MVGTKNDNAWNEIFEKEGIQEILNKKGVCEISSTTINKYRESRLMTKFDFSTQLPAKFKEHNLSLLPITRGTYLIGKFTIFEKFDSDQNLPLKTKPFPYFIKSIDFKDISSEAIAINCAYISKILNDFCEEDTLYPTLSGRMGSSNFDFSIKGNDNKIYNIGVKNAQIEIDGSFEGLNSICLIEAKNVLTEDFIIRQLYYPYRLLIDRTNKLVKPVFLTYTNGFFHLREYEFEQPCIYNSIKLLRHDVYSIIDFKITERNLKDILAQVIYEEEPNDVPFPQADDFERVINLCEQINEIGSRPKIDLCYEYGFVPRQADYYSNAAIYLGWLEKRQTNGITFLFLSEYGKKLFNLQLKDRQIFFIKSIIRHRPFGESLKYYLDTKEVPSKEEIVSFMRGTSNINISSDLTFERRAQSVASWTRWIIRNLDN